RFLLQRVAHLQPRARRRSLRPERDRGVRFVALESDRSHIHVHRPHIYFARNVIDYALTDRFFVLTGAIAGGEGAAQQGWNYKGFHGLIIAETRPSSSNCVASTATSIPSF